jgi:hypothetical protein
MIEAWSDEMGDRCDLSWWCSVWSVPTGGWHQYDRYVQRVTEQQQRCALSREAFWLVDRLGLPTDQLREWTLPGCWRMISRDDVPTSVRGNGDRPISRR